MNGQSYIRETFGLKMKKYKESEYYKGLYWNRIPVEQRDKYRKLRSGR